jgi:xanthine dehydrogenase accessory factor
MTSLYAILADLERAGQAAVLCTIVRARGSVPRHVGSKLLVYADGRSEGTIGGGEMEGRVLQAAREALSDGQARLVHYELVDPQSGDPGVCGGEVDIFVEPVKPAPTLLVIGGGHVGRALVHLGGWLGFRVVLSDDRPEFCTPQAVPGADEYHCGSIRDLAATFPFHAETYIVMPTRGVPVDVDGLPALLERPHAYLGVIGSRRRWATARKQLLERGVPEAALARVRAPMGLELNAETPEEIAVSVLAEVIMVQRGGTGAPMAAMEEKSTAAG